VELTVCETPLLSLTAIARARTFELDRLVAHLRACAGPVSREIVVGVETAGAAAPTEAVDDDGVRWIALPPRRGIGYNRERVLEAVRGDIAVSVDDDCIPEGDWLTELLSALDDSTIDAAVGRVTVPPAGLLGDSISALGFPAGGSAGYETMFLVREDGTTDNVSCGNFAIRTAVLREVGGYDESMVHGGEDTELAYRLNTSGRRIAFVPTAAIVHPARTSLREFARWFYVRGRAKRQFSRKIPSTGYVARRLASYGRILRSNLLDLKIVLIVPLLFASVALQQAGFVIETIRPTHRP